MNGSQAPMVANEKDEAGSLNTQWKNSLTFKFTIVQFVVAVLIIASSIWLIFSTEKKHHMDTQLSLSQNYGLAVIEQLQQVTSKIETLANTIGIVGETYRGQDEVVKELIPSLLDIGERHQLIAGGGIWPEPGMFGKQKTRNSFFWARDKHDEFQYLDNYNSAEGPGYHQAFWYLPAKYFQDGHTHWSKSYVDPYTKEVMITASVPMRANHSFIGVATVDIALRGLDKRFNFSDQNPLSKGYILALDSYNNLLADPFDESDKQQTAMLGQPLSRLIQRYPQLAPIAKRIETMDQTFSQQIMTSPAYRPEQLEKVLVQTPREERERLTTLINASIRGSHGKTPIVTLELSSDPLFNEPVLVSILTMAQTQWKIILVTPLSSLASQANAIALKIGAFLLLAQLIALLILFIFQHKLFIRPIFQIVSALQSGNLGRLELDANKRHDEVGQLAKAFIARSNQLEIAYASLDASNLALEQQLAMQQLAQQELENKKELINSLLNASQNLICIKDTHGSYSLVNDKFCEVMGIERARVIGMRDSDLYPAHIAEIINHHDHIILDSDQAQSFEQPMPTVHGERIYLITKYPIKDKDGNIIALGAMAVDISSLKAKQAELEQTIKLQGARNTELKQALDAKPQAVVKEGIDPKGLAQLKQIELAQQAILPQVVHQLLRQELQALEQIFIMLRQLDAADIEEPQLAKFTEALTSQIDIIRHGQSLISADITDVRATVADLFLQDLVAMLRPQLEAKGVAVEIDCPHHLTLPISPWHFLVLCHRLLGNSLQHAFPDGQALNRPKQLRIGIRYQEGVLTLTLRDNGLGIGQARLEKLIQALDSNSNSSGKGQGSLIHINQWLKAHFNGRLTVASQSAQFTELVCELHLDMA
ncbi:PAS domain-containing protein [Shewanella spartinae]|uniref:PAS domain-containing protein n=1 Tax=Shewanella spartinae TaxID=2864205 RepID=UPI001C661688|nr:PAS domain-containing protein [Shewanella spartinae]QYJ92290.1 PAS domain-containing protein [Shewanella spartinae]